MKGILLAGGLGTRLYPLTRVVNKHLLPLYDRPMFYWPLQTLIDSGVNQIAIVSGPPNGHQIKEAIKYFPKKPKVDLVYINQKKPLGLPDAVYSCKKFIGSDSFIMSVGDNIYGQDFRNEIKNFKGGATAFARKVTDPNRFAVVVYNEQNRIEKIIEKPKKFISSWAVGAPYIFDNFAIKKIESLKPSKRGELEIVDLLKLYLKEESLRLLKRRDVWIDTGTHESLLRGNLIVKKILLKKHTMNGVGNKT